MNSEQAAANKRAAAKAGAASEQLGDVVERVSDAVVALDRDWRYTYVNHEAGRLFGRDPAQLIGKHIWTEFPEGVGQPFHLAYEKALAEQKFIQIEAFYEPWQRWFENRIFPSPDGLSIFFHDITDRKLAEEAARESEQLLQCQNQILELIARDTPLDRVLEQLIRMIEDQSPGMIASILLLDPEGKHLHHVIAPRLPQGYTQLLDGGEIGTLAGSCGTEAFPREQVIVEDIATDPLWEGCRELALTHGLRACWSTPIFDQDQLVLGTFALYCEKPSRPKDFQLKQMEIAARSAAIAISKHRKTEDLRSSEERLRLAVAAGKVGVWEWDTLTGRMNYNERLKEIFGLSNAQHELTYDDFHAALHPDDLALVDAVKSRSFERQRDYDLEFRIIWPDESIHWIASRGSMLHDDEGMPVLMFGVAIDITQRKQAEEEIKRRDTLLRHAEAIANFGSYEWTPVTNAVIRSQQLCRIFGVPCEDWEPTLEGYLKRVHPEDRENSRRIIEQATRDHTRFRYEERIVLPDGTIRQLVDEGKWVQDEQRNTGKLVGICQDITEQKKEERAKAELENQLRQIQRLDSIGRFAGGIAHDFNNLLTLIMGYSELARERVRNDEAARASVEEIRKAAEKAVALTRQLLAFSRRQVLHPVIVDLNSVVENFSTLLRPLIRDEITLDIASAQDLGSIKADPTQIEQVLMNLVLNSRDAITGRGEIVIETRNVTLGEEYAAVHPDLPAGPYVMLTVADSGSGMDKETKAHVFEPFFTTKPEGRGTGLGLSVVHGIVKQFGGHIRVLSTPGTGTAFKILFPRADSAKAQPPQIAPSIAKGSETIVVVEDEFPIRHMISTELEREGYRVHAVNASDALEIAGHSCKFDLLLTAVVMPEMSGPELASRFRSARPDMKTLFVSGYPRKMLEYQEVLAPEAFLLENPFTKQELLACVRMALDSPSRSLEKVA